SNPNTYTLSLHDALPISWAKSEVLQQQANVFLFHLILGVLIVGGALYLLDISAVRAWQFLSGARAAASPSANPSEATTVEVATRSEEHTSELQSRENLVC